jgi:hypothetical protein
MLMQAAIMQYKTVYTDHSLFNFHDHGIHQQNALKLSLSSLPVSSPCPVHVLENLVLRVTHAIVLRVCRVIPTPWTSSCFLPRGVGPLTPTLLTLNRRVESTRVSESEIDLIAQAIPKLGYDVPTHDVSIGGDGPKKLLHEMVEQQIGLIASFLGHVPHEHVW